MQLIGMLDSPYVRRVAISLEALGISFEHIPVSVFGEFEKFRKTNPVVKAPTLICDNGDFIMDSSIILQFIEATYSKNGTLWNSHHFQQEFKIVSLALAACDKSVQIVYESNLRPKERQYEPWLERTKGQALSAISLLEEEVKNKPNIFSTELNQATITTVVGWTFIQSMLPDVVPAPQYPYLSALSDKIEGLTPFQTYPSDGPGVNP